MTLGMNIPVQIHNMKCSDHHPVQKSPKSGLSGQELGSLPVVACRFEISSRLAFFRLALFMSWRNLFLRLGSSVIEYIS